MVVKKAKTVDAGWKGWNCCGGSGVHFGLIIILIGLYMFATDMGWIQTNISFWTILLLVLGLSLFLGGLKKKTWC